jgi:purine-binding chemotaxis protein CheW
MQRQRDWEGLHHRLEEVRRRLESGYRPPREEKERILRDRARIMARPLEPEGCDGERMTVLEFLLARERYAAPTNLVREVYPLRALCRLPCAPPFVVGIINVRGAILSVVDIKKLFDLPEKGITNLNRVVAVHSGTSIFGILADGVTGTREVRLRDLEPPFPTLSGLHREYVMGITGERIIVLNIETMLADPRLVIHEEV